MRRGAGRRAVAPAALGDHPFIARERGSGTRAVAEAALAAHDVGPPVALTLGGTEAIKEAVAAGLGLAIVSRAAAADALALGRVAAVRVEGLDIRRPLTRLHLEGRRPSAPAVTFEALLAAGGGPGGRPAY